MLHWCKLVDYGWLHPLVTRLTVLLMAKVHLRSCRPGKISRPVTLVRTPCKQSRPGSAVGGGKVACRKAGQRFGGKAGEAGGGPPTPPPPPPAVSEALSSRLETEPDSEPVTESAPPPPPNLPQRVVSSTSSEATDSDGGFDFVLPLGPIDSSDESEKPPPAEEDVLMHFYTKHKPVSEQPDYQLLPKPCAVRLIYY